MPEVENEIIFEISASSLFFATQQNGDKLVITEMSLSQDQATSLCWLVNSHKDLILEVQIKVKD